MGFLKPRYECDFCGIIREARRNINDIVLSGKLWQEPEGWISGSKHTYLVACFKPECQQRLRETEHA